MQGAERSNNVRRKKVCKSKEHRRGKAKVQQKTNKEIGVVERNCKATRSNNKKVTRSSNMESNKKQHQGTIKEQQEATTGKAARSNIKEL